MDNKTKAYIHSIFLRKTFEAISFCHIRHNLLRGMGREVAVIKARKKTAKFLELYNGDEQSANNTKVIIVYF